MTGNELFDLDTFIFGRLNFDSTLATLLGAKNEKVTVSVGAATGGTFDLTINGQLVAANAYNITGANLQIAINTILGTNSATVTGNGPWVIEFTGNGFNNQQVSVTGTSSLTGGALTVTETQMGVSRVFAEKAPQNTPGPFVIVNFQSSTETIAIGAVRVVFRPLMCVKAVTQENSFYNANLIAQRVDELIMGSHGQATDGLNMACAGSEGAYRYTELVQGLRWNYVGRLYRFFIS